MGKPRLLDLFCCAGGAGMGYARAGFEVVGVDKDPRPHYPFAFIQADVLTLTPAFLAEFDAIHASPPCQAHSGTHNIHRKGRVGGYRKPRESDARDDHKNLIPETRLLLQSARRPYVIENVVGARPHLIQPLMLCGTQFGLQVYRHRLFETNFPVGGLLPAHQPHVRGATKATDGYSTLARGASIICCAGNNFRRVEGMAAMGLDWPMTRWEVAQAIPPAYTEFLGRQLMAYIQRREAA